MGFASFPWSMGASVSERRKWVGSGTPQSTGRIEWVGMEFIGFE